MGDNKSNQNKSMGLIIALVVAILAAVVVLIIAMISLSKNDGAHGGENTTLYTLADVTQSASDTTSFYIDDETEEEKEGSYSQQAGPGFTFDSGNNVEAGADVTVATTQAGEKYDPVKEYEKLSKNGDNILSDHHNNKYIKMVHEKYSIDTENLVAIYSSPDTGNNFVLEFKNEKDSIGNIIKSPDTLKRVYLIDKKGDIAIATGTTSGNVGVSYAEGTLCFNMVKTIVMPQYPEYFTGV